MNTENISSKIRWEIASDFYLLEEWLKNMPFIFEKQGVSIFKGRNEIKIFQELGFELNVKSFKIPNVINRFAYLYLRGSKAARSYCHALHMSSVGAATPQAVGYIECVKNGLLKQSYYVSVNHPCEFTLREVLNNEIPDREQILKEWVRFTYYQLHQKGIFHLDYSAGNILINKFEDRYNFSIVDLNRMKFTTVGFKKGLQNFKQLYADPDTLKLIGEEYALICGEKPSKAVKMLIQFDHSNKKFRRHRQNIKQIARKAFVSENQAE